MKPTGILLFDVGFVNYLDSACIKIEIAPILVVVALLHSKFSPVTKDDQKIIRYAICFE